MNKVTVLLAAFLVAPAGLVQCLHGERRRRRWCASRVSPQLRDGLRWFRAGLGRSSGDPTAASEAKDCNLPSKNLDRPLFKRSCVMSADILKRSSDPSEEELAAASSSSNDEPAADSLDMDMDGDSQSDSEMMSSWSAYATALAPRLT